MKDTVFPMLRLAARGLFAILGAEVEASAAESGDSFFADKVARPSSLRFAPILRRQMPQRLARVRAFLHAKDLHFHKTSRLMHGLVALSPPMVVARRSPADAVAQVLSTPCGDPDAR